MNIGFVVNELATERAVFTTTRLGMIAVNRGHTVWFIDAADFSLDADDRVHAWAASAPGRKYNSPNTYFGALRRKGAKLERIVVDDLDVLMLRSNPASESALRNWARTAGVIFGRVAMRGGAIVLNDPNALANCTDKMYLQLLPQEVRPRTIISQDRDEIRSFVKDVGNHAVLKPLVGSSATSIFRVTPDNRSNLNQKNQLSWISWNLSLRRLNRSLERWCDSVIF